MEIKTKFNVGDKVYRLTGVLFHRIEPKHKIGYKELKIKEIKIEIIFIPAIQKDVATIKYKYDSFIVDSPCYAWIEEKDCFSTQAEAQAECDKRNKGE